MPGQLCVCVLTTEEASTQEHTWPETALATSPCKGSTVEGVVLAKEEAATLQTAAATLAAATFAEGEKAILVEEEAETLAEGEKATLQKAEETVVRLVDTSYNFQCN